MKTISSQLAAHLALSSTTLATLWKVKRRDNTIIGFTDHDKDVKYDASDGDGTVTYVASTGFTPTAIETGSDLGVDNLEVTAFLEVDAISDVDLRNGVYDFCSIEIRIVNYMDLTQGDLKFRSGTVGQVKSQNGIGNFEIRGLIFYTSTAIGQLYGPTCRVELGSTECGIDLSLWIQNGLVESVTDRQTFVPGSAPSSTPLLMRGSATPTLPAPPGWFSNGVIVWTSGANAGFSMECKNWDGTTVTLFENMGFDIQPGDTFTIEPGCNLGSGPTGDCQNKFVNIVNFRGEPFIPGADQIMIYPNADGSVPK